MEDVLQLFLKAIIFILKYLKIAIDWALVKLESVSAKLSAKVKAKAETTPVAPVKAEKTAEEAPIAPETEEPKVEVPAEETNSEEKTQ